MADISDLLVTNKLLIHHSSITIIYQKAEVSKVKIVSAFLRECEHQFKPFKIQGKDCSGIMFSIHLGVSGLTDNPGHKKVLYLTTKTVQS